MNNLASAVASIVDTQRDTKKQLAIILALLKPVLLRQGQSMMTLLPSAVKRASPSLI